jgi:hypothetical protein
LCARPEIESSSPRLKPLSFQSRTEKAHYTLIGAASLGGVGLDWRLGGFAGDPPTGSMDSAGSTSELVQAMAGFGGGSGAADSLNTVPLGTDTSQQSLLTTPRA